MFKLLQPPIDLILRWTAMDIKSSQLNKSINL